MRLRRSTGFSLVEILVAIGMLLLLAGLVLAVVARARSAARERTCASHLHQIGVALALYTQDNHGGLVQCHMQVGPTLCCSYTWRAAILPYVKQANLFYGPSSNAPLWVSANNPFTGRFPDIFQPSSYAINTVHRVPPKPEPPGEDVAREAQIRSPSTLVYVVEGNGYYRWDNYLASGRQGDNGPGYVRGDDPLDRAARYHSGGSNYLFFDGHVRRLRPEQLTCTCHALRLGSRRHPLKGDRWTGARAMRHDTCTLMKAEERGSQPCAPIGGPT